MEKEELYNEAWRLWGGDMQLDILIEEMAELTLARLEERLCAAKGGVKDQ